MAPRIVGRIDAWQRRHPVVAFPVAVVRKFSGDDGGSMAALLSYYAFLATFPLLLVFVTLLEFVLRGDPHLQRKVLDSALVEFPVIGDQLEANIGKVPGQGVGLVIGLVVAFIGARGLAAAFQRVCNELWGVPRVRRSSFPRALLRTLALLLLFGLGALSGVLVVTVVGAFSSGVLTQIGTVVASVVINCVLFFVAFRLATASEVRSRDLVTSAVVSGVMWELLLALGTVLVAHRLKDASALYGVFGVVLGLLAWFALQATVTLFAIELDVVRARRLWPRGLVAPKTEADERTLALYVTTQQRDDDQQVQVRFDGREVGES